METLFIFLAFSFLFTFLAGKLIERFRVPWVFAALILGMLLSPFDFAREIATSQAFTFLAKLGMYFLLFIIGLEMDLREMKKESSFIVKAAFSIILFETLFGSLLIHFVFGYDWLISVLVALSFATVGEAILVPILDEFNAINTKLGRAIVGVGTFDDLFEIICLIFVASLVGKELGISPLLMPVSLGLLFLLMFLIVKLHGKEIKFEFPTIGTTFLFAVFILLLFIGIGELGDAAPLAALLAGISLRSFLPAKKLKLVESEIKAVCYGMFAPIFFLWVGMTIDANYLFLNLPLVLLVVLVSKLTKLFASYLVARSELGTLGSLLLGLGLSIRFSTSIVIVKLLFESGLISSDLYSVIVASSVVFKFLIPLIFANLLRKYTSSL